MAGGWTFSGQPVQVGGAVTLVEGTSFCLSDPAGDITPGAPQGVFFRDTRILSAWQLRLDDRGVESLTVIAEEPYRATFVGRALPAPGQVGESTLLVERQRFVGAGMREDIALRNLSSETVEYTLNVHVEADFADLFDVKEGRVRDLGEHSVDHKDGEIRVTRHWREQSRGIRLIAEGAISTPKELTFHAVIPARDTWRTSVLLCPVVDGVEIPPSFPLERPLEHTGPAVRTSRWLETGPRLVTGDEALNATLRTSRRDLGSLRMSDPELPNTPVVAAGTPWFMALFGRDSIITSLMSLSTDPALALGTAQTLALHQGRKVDPLTEEEPGRIPHELRFGLDSSLAIGGNVYYGTADATPLFVMLLAELRRWGVDREEVLALLPHADRALEWITHYGDKDGDGFVEYQRTTDRGLENQGWKDSWDGVSYADGRIATAPIALAEVQGYVHGAYLARALLAEDMDDPEGARHWQDQAARTKQAFNDRFWLPERGWYALGLDGDKQPIDALASNMGHCLWTGTVDADKAPRVAELLRSPEMLSGWGIRTLAATMGAYNPMSYHNGSVWPHDSAIVAGGLRRYGFVEDAQRVASGVLEAAASVGGRLPELMCGFDRSEYSQPVPYPTSCSPQAWASAAPLHLLRELLGAEPCVPHGCFRLAPALPSWFGDVTLEDIPLADARIRITVQDGKASVEGLPAGIQLTSERCPCHA
ncbi:amylo-alpha-1,6-glucosidase [Actinacidiphila oryziradicis]|uniref:Amylo-alpha-1,6-glucosidase n=1 Tax=Actinacidiphila oryziradicis TaxID=2571141 RepID=A0A4V5MXZ9_9ACTN|nr:amylo-alpha-1,6-glucosidase [Actinacidiphila oryziradicis]